MSTIHLTFDREYGRRLLTVLRETPVAGRVHYLADDLSFGPVPVDTDNFYPRIQWLEAFFGEYSLETQEASYFRSLALLTEIGDQLRHPGTRLILWPQNRTSDRTWLDYLARYFQDWDAIDWVHWEKTGDTGSTSEQIRTLTNQVTHPDTTRIMSLADEYDRLRNERSLLRLIRDDDLISVPVSTFDQEIQSMNELTEQKTSELAKKLGVSPAFITGRYRQLQAD